MVNGPEPPARRVPKREEAPTVQADGGVRRLPLRHAPLTDAGHGGQAGGLARAGRLARPRGRAGRRASSTASRGGCCTTAAVRHLRVLVTEMQRLMGPVSVDGYDDIGPAPEGLVDLSAELCSVLERYAPAGCPLWPPPASSAYAALLQGEAPAYCALTWDASTFGWAALARWWDLSGPGPVARELLLVGTWPDGWGVSEQPFSEALGGALGFEAFVSAVDVCGRYCVLRSDCAAAIAALRKGSTQSPQMQCCALRLSRAAAAVNIDCLPLHVLGLVLIAEGVDGVSRYGSELGPDANVPRCSARPSTTRYGTRCCEWLRPAGGGSLWTPSPPRAMRGPRASGAGSLSPARSCSTPCVLLTGRRACARCAVRPIGRCSTRSRQPGWCEPRSRRRARHQ